MGKWFVRLSLILIPISLISGLVPSKRVDASPLKQDIPQLPLCKNQEDFLYPCEVSWEWSPVDFAGRAGLFKAEDDNILTIAYQTSADRVALVGDISTELKQIEDNWWGIAVQIPERDQASLSIAPLLMMNGRWQVDHLEFQTWQGSDMLSLPPQVETLEGSLEIYPLADNNDFHRDIAVYLPSDHQPDQTYPVIYMADGQLVNRFAPFIEYLIVNQQIPAVILVGVYPGQPRESDDDPRAAEYLPGWDEGRFQAHLDFWLETVLPWAEAEFGASDERSQRSVFGLSNGAAFAAWIGQHRSQYFGNVIAFSLGWDIELTDHSNYPVRHYLAAGRLEPHFHEQTSAWYQQLLNQGEIAVFSEQVSGHSFRTWLLEFPLAVQWIFSSDKAE